MRFIKVKLKITKVVNNEEFNTYLLGIKDKNKISYMDDNTLVVVETKENLLKIKTSSDIENNMEFKNNRVTHGYFKCLNNTIPYEILTKKLKIRDKKIELEYKIEDNNKYILEVL